MSEVVAHSVTRSFASADDIDFGSSAGLQQLLSVIRQTPLSRSDYNELRDLVLSYKQSANDEAKKQAVLVALSNVGLLPSEAMPSITKSGTPPDEAVNQVPIRKMETPLPVEKVVESVTLKPTQSVRSGLTRPSPTFAPQSVLKKQAVESAQHDISKSIATPEVEVVVESISAEPTPKLTETQESTSASVVGDLSQSIPAPVKSPAPVESVPEPTPTSAPASRASSPEETAAAVANEDPAERIKLIKREVNALVGNPVNLIDADNNIGREYMNSLLDAMKKINGGSSADVSAAMSRLEAAYEQVKLMQIGPDAVTATGNAVAASKPAPAAALSPTPQSVSSVNSPNQPASGFIPTAGLPKSRLFEKIEEPEPVTIDSAPKVAEAPEAPLVPKTPMGQPASATHNAPSPDAITVSNIPPAQPLTPESVVPTTRPVFESVAVSKEKQTEQLVKTIEESKKEEAKQQAEIAAMDPLMTPDVTNGLNQLLSEWVLFKSSGIFGTGPSGAEHPLYKQLANLQMSAVIAGRFDGATPEIRQSIADYMNGWRYEEGILHQHGETFERYLRRVIKKILEHKRVSVE